MDLKLFPPRRSRTSVNLGLGCPCSRIRSCCLGCQSPWPIHRGIASHPRGPSNRPAWILVSASTRVFFSDPCASKTFISHCFSQSPASLPIFIHRKVLGNGATKKGLSSGFSSTATIRENEKISPKDNSASLKSLQSYTIESYKTF